MVHKFFLLVFPLLLTPHTCVTLLLPCAYYFPLFLLFSFSLSSLTHSSHFGALLPSFVPPSPIPFFLSSFLTSHALTFSTFPFLIISLALLIRIPHTFFPPSFTSFHFLLYFLHSSLSVLPSPLSLSDHVLLHFLCFSTSPPSLSTFSLVI